MSDLVITTGGDLQVTNGEIAWVHGGDAIAQNIRTRLLSWFGENAYDSTMGTPWAQVFFGRDSTDAERKLAIEATILTVRGVDSVSVSSVNMDTAGLCTISGSASSDGRDIDFTVDAETP